MLVLFFEQGDVHAWFILCTSRKTYVLILKKIILFYTKVGFGECAYETGGVR